MRGVCGPLGVGEGDIAGLTKAGVLSEIPEELLTLLLHVPTPTAAAPGGHHDASEAGVHIVGRHVKPWAWRKGGKGERSSEDSFSGTTEKRLGILPPSPQTNIISTHNPNSEHYYPSNHRDPRGQRGVGTEDRPGRPRRHPGAPPSAWPLLSP